MLIYQELKLPRFMVDIMIVVNKNALDCTGLLKQTL